MAYIHMHLNVQKKVKDINNKKIFLFVKFCKTVLNQPHHNKKFLLAFYVTFVYDKKNPEINV